MTALFEIETRPVPIQEMLRTERSRSVTVQHELDTYNALVPADDELSVTVFINTRARRGERMLQALVGVETKFYVSIDGERTLGTGPSGRPRRSRDRGALPQISARARAAGRGQSRIGGGLVSSIRRTARRARSAPQAWPACATTTVEVASCVSRVRATPRARAVCELFLGQHAAPCAASRAARRRQDVLYVLGGDRSRVIGNMSPPSDRAGVSAHVIGVRFRPGAAIDLLGVSGNELRGRQRAPPTCGARGPIAR